MAKRRKSRARKPDRARHIVTVNMPASHAAWLDHVAKLAAVPVDTAASVVLAIEVIRQLSQIPPNKIDKARNLEDARRVVRSKWRATRKGRKLVATRSRR